MASILLNIQVLYTCCYFMSHQTLYLCKEVLNVDSWQMHSQHYNMYSMWWTLWFIACWKASWTCLISLVLNMQSSFLVLFYSLMAVVFSEWLIHSSLPVARAFGITTGHSICPKRNNIWYLFESNTIYCCQVIVVKWVGVIFLIIVNVMWLTAYTIVDAVHAL